MQGHSTVPGVAQLQAVWPHNMDLGRAKNGDVIRFEAWGAVSVVELQSGWETGSCFKTSWLFLEELQNLLLVEFSHREKEIRHVALLVDAGGMSMAHKELAQFLQEVSVRCSCAPAP